MNRELIVAECGLSGQTSNAFETIDAVDELTLSAKSPIVGVAAQVRVDKSAGS